jgi:dTDP-4-dehydrorhamnose 3,5-epimerase
MRIIRSDKIPDVMILQPQVLGDMAGRVVETYRTKELMEEAGAPVSFIQNNLYYMSPYTLRGLYIQPQWPQGKLFTCISGTVQQIAVDLREHSNFFGKYVNTLLDSEKCLSVLIPPGFASGFLAYGIISAVVSCQSTLYDVEGCGEVINWNDPDLSINWYLPSGRKPVISNHDRAAPTLREFKEKHGLFM